MKDKKLCTKMLECLTGNIIEDNLNRVYDAEMQNLTTVTKKELPLRSRFYQGMINKGKREGRLEGRLETLISLVKDGDLNIDIAAQKAEMSVTEFEKLINA